MGKFVGFLALLASLAIGAAWYAMRPGLGRIPRGEAARAVAGADADASWLSDLYSQNPRDVERGKAKVTGLGAHALPDVQATLRDPAAGHDRRRAALRACGILGVTAVPAMRDVAALLRAPDLTDEAAAALSFMGPGALPALQQGLSSDDPAVRREALRSVGKMRFRAPLESGTVLPLLLDGMTDPDEGVRAVAATYLGIIHEDAAASVPLLAQALQDADTTVRRAAATALGSFGADAAPAVPGLRKAAGDRDPDLAREAGRALVAVGGAR